MNSLIQPQDWWILILSILNIGVLALGWLKYQFAQISGCFVLGFTSFFVLLRYGAARMLIHVLATFVLAHFLILLAKRYWKT